MNPSYHVPYVTVRCGDLGIGGGGAVRAWRRLATDDGRWHHTDWHVYVEIGPGQYFSAPAVVDDFGTLVLTGPLQ